MKNEYPHTIKFKPSSVYDEMYVSNVILNVSKWILKISARKDNGIIMRRITCEVNDMNELARYLHETDYKIFKYLLNTTFKPYKMLISNYIKLPPPLADLVTDYVFYS